MKFLKGRFMNKTKIITETSSFLEEIQNILYASKCKKPFLVCGNSFMKNPCYQKLLDLWKDQIISFHDYEPNPSYDSVVNAVNMFLDNHCDFLISIGGGSPMDLAKSVKAFAFMNPDIPYVDQEITKNDIKHLAIPTTAGTGSEATHFAVIYYKGKKHSVSHESLIPDHTILNAELLYGLPDYQRKATMLDTLCHSMESFWSVNSSEKSREYSKKAIQLFLSSYQDFLNNQPEGNRKMLQAANLAGKAINLTTTTAAHAMCYKLTSLYGISHGHAAFLCFTKLWNYMNTHKGEIHDSRGSEYVESGFLKLSHLLGCRSPKDAVQFLENLSAELELSVPKLCSPQELDDLVSSVNIQRLNNHPITLTSQDLTKIYQDILPDHTSYLSLV